MAFSFSARVFFRQVQLHFLAKAGDLQWQVEIVAGAVADGGHFFSLSDCVSGSFIEILSDTGSA
jgi:hypothetical protein